MMFFAFGLVFFDRLSITFLFPFISKDFHLNNTQIGLLVSVLGLTWAVSGPAIGLFADSYGKNKKYVLLTMILLFSVCSFLSGIAIGFLMLFLVRGLMGIFEGPVLPMAQSIMAAETSESRRGFNMGLIQVSGPALLASLIGPLVIVAVAILYSWRVAFYLTAIPTFILALFMWKYLRTPKVSLPVQDKADPTHTSSEKVSLKDVFKHRNIWLAVIISCFSITWYIVNVTFDPTYFVQVFHMSLTSMSIVMAGIGAGGFLWGFIVPLISDRIGRKPTMIIFAFISALFSLMILYVARYLAIVPLAVMAVIFFNGQGFMPIYMSILPAESIPPKYVATAIGVIMGAGEIFGGVIVPTIAGVAADHFGLQATMWVSFIAAILCGIVSMFVIETAPIKIKKNRSLANLAG
jgi:MFS family permease